MSSLTCLQVLEYNVEAETWTEIGNLEIGREFHAIAEVNLGDVGCVGNPVSKSKQNHQNLSTPLLKSTLILSVLLVITIIIIAKDLCVQTSLNVQLVIQFKN